MTFNTTTGAETFSGPWNNTSPTSSVFSSGTSWWTNGDNMLSYCWTPIPGYSAFGTYTGNSSTDGTFVYLGFRPRWLLIKGTGSGGSGWILLDSTRDIYNAATKDLRSDLTNAESISAGAVDFLHWLSVGAQPSDTVARLMKTASKTAA